MTTRLVQARALGRPTSPLRMPDRKTAASQQPDWGLRRHDFPVGEPHLRGAYCGNESTPHGQASMFYLVHRLVRSRFPGGTCGHPQAVQPGDYQTLTRYARFPRGTGCLLELQRCLHRHACSLFVPQFLRPCQYKLRIYFASGFSYLQTCRAPEGFLG